jgi:signal peptidase II
LTGSRLSILAIAISTAIANFLLDRYMQGSAGRVLIPRLADFSPTLNRGVSFGLLTPDSPTKYHLLIALLVLITLFVGAMAWRASTCWASIGYGLILGGALGNLSDRIFNGGAVFDFLALHVGKMPLFVCNFPDVVITAGVVVLLGESVFAGRVKSPAA